ncbi:MAG: M23 family metallopeptidase [Azoarcus sp.]|jgi:murein DD-endopeptidase MepM/ murein hydrolase activator NlpD|nr:M23 family metallopeptidase [Azoarcus sp.]
MKRGFPVLALLCLSPLAAGGSADDYPLELKQHKTAQGVQIVAENKGPATVSVFFSLSGTNLQTDKKTPLTVVIPPKTGRDIVRITPAEHTARYRFDCRYDVIVGDAFMPPDRGYYYRIPLAKGTSARIEQEPNGQIFTHHDAQTRYAVDFAVPEGTPVVAARDGVVVETKDRYSIGRPDPALATQANFVAVMHADHSVAYYYHLARHRVQVSAGQRVRAGDLLAYSGNTGYSNGPHLHFDVRHAAVDGDGTVAQVSIPVDFYRASGQKIPIREGLQVVAD